MSRHPGHRETRRVALLSLSPVLAFCLATDFLLANAVGARPARHELHQEALPPDRIGGERDAAGTVNKMGTDTLWIADWNFSAGSECSAQGWERFDNRILNDGSNYWSVVDTYDTMGNIVDNAAVLSKHDLCWVFPDGYGNDWDYSIVCRYVGASTLSFDYLLDSEFDYDFLRVEADSACASEDRVDYSLDPIGTPAAFRQLLFETSGLDTAGRIDTLALPDFGAPTDTHCVYIRFVSDPAYSPEDGVVPTTLGAALVVDNLEVTGGLSTNEDFEAQLDPNLSLVNSAPSEPFGLWARLNFDVSDNDLCSDAPGCAWLHTDPALPAYSPEMAFGPGGAVIRNWLDEVIIGPWVSLAPAAGATGSVLEIRRFPGNFFSTSRIVQGWSVRGRTRVANTDTPAPGDSLDCVTPWGHAFQWNSLSLFSWVTQTWEMGSDIPEGSRSIQLRFRVSDWQYIAGYAPPTPFDPGPGPYLGRVRIGAVIEDAPRLSIPNTAYAQDTYATTPVQNPGGLFYEPTTDRFGTGDFSQARTNTYGWPNVTPYSIDALHVRVEDINDTGGIASVELYGRIVDGPHAGKAPPPLSVGAHGFFVVSADTAYNEYGNKIADHWQADLDDDYFRGGDVVHYFWLAQDMAGNKQSYPDGLVSEPTSPAQVDQATGGLLEYSMLPKIDWDPAYLQRIAQDPSGKLEPTPQEIAASTQSNCMLYIQIVNLERRAGPSHRTTFMYTLDALGYKGKYDVYDHANGLFISGNSHIAGNATVEQATGYALIVDDVDGTWIQSIPIGMEGGALLGDGSAATQRALGFDPYFAQSQWFRDWLAQAGSSETGRGTLWVIGRDQASTWKYEPSHVVNADMGVVSTTNISELFPEVIGQTGFQWDSGTVSDFVGNDLQFSSGECSRLLYYDGIDASGTATVTHRFRSNGIVGDGAIVMNSNAAASWNTVFMSLDWSQALDPDNGIATPHFDLVDTILGCALPDSCRADTTTTDTPTREPGVDNVPRVTALYANVPNPFNPATKIRFDLAVAGRVTLTIYDVAGRRLRTLVDASLAADSHEVLWDGLDERGRRTATGIYLYRLEAPGFSATRRMLLLK